MARKGRLVVGGELALVLLSALVAPTLIFGKQERPEESARLRLFFSPHGAPSARTLARLRKIQTDHPGLRIDHHLLVGDFRDLSIAPSEKFQAAIKSLRESGGPEFGLSIYDEEGVRLAARYRLTRLPAAVLERGSRAHVAYGADPDLEELLKCRK